MFPAHPLQKKVWRCHWILSLQNSAESNVFCLIVFFFLFFPFFYWTNRGHRANTNEKREHEVTQSFDAVLTKPIARTILSQQCRYNWKPFIKTSRFFLFLTLILCQLSSQKRVFQSSFVSPSLDLPNTGPFLKNWLAFSKKK